MPIASMVRVKARPDDGNEDERDENLRERPGEIDRRRDDRGRTGPPK